MTALAELSRLVRTRAPILPLDYVPQRSRAEIIVRIVRREIDELNRLPLPKTKTEALMRLARAVFIESLAHGHDADTAHDAAMFELSSRPGRFDFDEARNDLRDLVDEIYEGIP